MAIHLKQVLKDNFIKQTVWAGAIQQHDGSPLSVTAASLILNKGVWPKETSQLSIMKQTTGFLADWGIEERDVWWSSKDAGGSLDASASDSDDVEQLPEVEMLSQKAKQHFGLFQDPFRNDVHGPDDLFLSSETRYIRESMWQAARTAGLIAIIGESGSGKTVLRRDVIDRANKADDVVVIMPSIIDKTKLNAGTICEAIIRTIAPNGTKMPISLEAKARLIEKLLTDASRGGVSHALMIEEAHDLTIPAVKYLKRFWELEDGFKKLLGIILVAQPEMKDTLNVGKNWSAREFINRCEVAELMPLDEDLENYLKLKFGRLNIALDKVFADDAFDAIRGKLMVQKRGGLVVSTLYPLMVNNLVTKAMNLVADMNKPLVNAALVGGV